jgi:phosphate transport system substrate-binding protein
LLHAYQREDNFLLPSPGFANEYDLEIQLSADTTAPMKTTFPNHLPGLRALRSTVLSTLALSAVLVGCSDKSQPAGTTGGGKIVIKGSNTIGEELGPRLIAEYKKTNPQADFTIETKGSASGFWGLIAGVCDVAAASRGPIKDEELQAQVRGIELKDYIIGSYSVAVVVHGSCPVSNLSKEQVRDLFTGTIQNWKDVGGPDLPVHLYTRDPISGTYLGFRELALEDKAYSTNLTTFTNYEKIVAAVAADPNGIGYASIQLAAKPGVKAVSIGGIAPAASTVKEGKYPFARVLHLYTNKSKEGSPAHQFIDFIESAQGQQIVDQMGFVPHK